MGKKAVSVVLSLLVTVILVAFLLRQTSIAELVATLSALPLSSVVLGLGLYALVPVFRGVRAWLLVRKAVPLDTLVSIMCVNNTMINVLPARTGELSYIYLLRRTGKVSVGTGMGTLALGRIFDLFAIVTLFFLATVLAPSLPAALESLRIPILIAAAAVLLAVVLVLIFHHASVRLMHRVLAALRLKRFKFVDWLARKVEEALESLHVVKNGWLVAVALVCSLAIWALLFSINALIFQGIGIAATWWTIALASSVSAFLAIIPIQGLIGFGTTEAWWTVALVGVGVASQDAIHAGFAQHLVALLYVLVMGVYGMLRLPKAQ
jgi:uncharacterized protein (TIRG00374 family)